MASKKKTKSEHVVDLDDLPWYLSLENVFRRLIGVEKKDTHHRQTALEIFRCLIVAAKDDSEDGQQTVRSLHHALFGTVTAKQKLLESIVESHRSSGDAEVMSLQLTELNPAFAALDLEFSERQLEKLRNGKRGARLVASELAKSVGLDVTKESIRKASDPRKSKSSRRKRNSI